MGRLGRTTIVHRLAVAVVLLIVHSIRVLELNWSHAYGGEPYQTRALPAGTFYDMIVS
jgi:hypothetical protein